MTEDYKGRIGNLIRDARKHRGLTQQQLAELLAPARARSTASRRATRTSPWRCWPGSARPSTPRSSRSAPGPTHLRVTGPTHAVRARSTSRRRKNAGVALLCASLLNRGRTTLRKVARIEEVNRLLEVLSSIGVQTRWLNDDNDLEIVPPKRARPRRDRRGRRAAYPLDHHVPRPAAAPRGRLRAARTPAAATSAPAPSSRTCPRCGRSASRSRRPTAATTPRSTGRSSRGAPIVLTERGDTVTENALMAAALHPGTTVIRNASPNYMVQDLCFFLQKLGVDDRRHRHHHADRHRRRATSTSTSTTPPARTRSRRCPCSPPRSSPSPRSPSAGCRSSSSRSSSRSLEEMGFQLRPLRGVRRRQRPHPPGRHHHPAVRRCTRRWTRSTRCRSPASTSTTCRSSR